MAQLQEKREPRGRVAKLPVQHLVAEARVRELILAREVPDEVVAAHLVLEQRDGVVEALVDGRAAVHPGEAEDEEPVRHLDKLVLEHGDQLEHGDGVVETVVGVLQRPHHHALARRLLALAALLLDLHVLREEVLVLAARLHHVPHADARKTQVVGGEDKVLEPRREHVGDFGAARAGRRLPVLSIVLVLVKDEVDAKVCADFLVSAREVEILLAQALHLPPRLQEPHMEADPKNRHPAPPRLVPPRL
mmetsp:Transcript_15922/g.38707  ORF Transcript_15922/g.38707 Transcript_15922/m.38707 type:complete len:248 (-) Transcript_15922:954-1697(-)